MAQKKDFYKILAVAGVSVIGGLLLGSYLRGLNDKGEPLSKHLDTISKLLQQIESVPIDDAENIKMRIQNILTNIESNYAEPKE